MGTGALIEAIIENKRPLRRFIIVFSVFFLLYVGGCFWGIDETDVVQAGLNNKAELIAIVGYLSFILCWGLAYASAFKFPSKMWLLIVGFLIGSALFTTIMFIHQDSFLQINGFSRRNIAITVLIMSPIASIFQLGFLVIFLQMFKRVARHTVWPKIKGFLKLQ